MILATPSDIIDPFNPSDPDEPSDPSDDPIIHSNEFLLYDGTPWISANPIRNRIALLFSDGIDGDPVIQ